MVERFHPKIKDTLRAADDPGNWLDNLLLVLGIRWKPKSDLDCSAAEVVFGTTLQLSRWSVQLLVVPKRLR
ncbi:unnamed protein product [Dibothriocephalus latus]|uniref:Uncharacterized protein n=1 Tax=Dibothriocephalus latus TaxID=60516 RepID=A0A3P7P475_DIBLA|nr:unnamed protein product [Dibothriocephalus latus]